MWPLGLFPDSQNPITETSRKHISSLFILYSKHFKTYVMGYVWNLKLHQGKANHIICFLLELLKKWEYTVLAKSVRRHKSFRVFRVFRVFLRNY